MRNALVGNNVAEALWREALEIEEYCRHRRQGWETRFGRRNGCPWDCDRGFHEVLFSELEWDHLAFADVIFPHGLALFACECNSRRVWDGGRYETVTVQPFEIG